MAEPAGTLEPIASLALEAPGEYSLYSWRNIDVMFWDGPASGPGVRRVSRFLFQQGRSSGGKRSGINIVAKVAATAPDPEALSEFVKLGQMQKRNVACIGVVVEEQGFFASAIKAMVTGLFIATGQSYAARLLNTLDEMADWLPEPHEKLTGVHVDPSELRRVIAEAKAHHGRKR